MRRLWIAVLLVVVALVVTACDHEDSSSRSVVLEQETLQADRIGERYNQTQPVPEFEWSQLRQNLIELIEVQARTTATTSFFFHMGAPEPIAWCPSIGFPIPATYQLTNPNRGIEVITSGKGANPAVGIAQLEATGVYTADTTGTYVMCVSSSGKVYAKYWEGFVMTDTGATQWQDGQVVLIGEPTFDFSEGR